MKKLELNLTEILFPLEEETPEDRRKLELWSKAFEEACKQLDQKSPMKLLNKTEKIYKGYLAENKMEYSEARGF